MKRSLILHERFFTSYFIFLPLSKFLAFRYDMTNCLITFSPQSILLQIHYYYYYYYYYYLLLSLLSLLLFIYSFLLQESWIEWYQSSATRDILSITKPAILVIMPRTFEYFRWIVKQHGIWISYHTQRHSMTVKYLKESLNFFND